MTSPNERAVLFDLDGVLVDSRPHHLNAWHQFAREAGVSHDAHYFTRMFGLRNDAIIGGLIPGVAGAQLQVMAARKEELFRREARGKLEALPGVRELLASLRAGRIPCAVVTSTPRENLALVLESLDIGAYFSALVAEEDAAKGKPDPEGFLVAASAVGVGPARCIVIEDAPAGLRAAKAAGMRAIGVTTTHPSTELGDADVVVDSLGEEAAGAFIFSAEDLGGR